MTLSELLERPERASSVRPEELPYLLADLKRLEVMLQIRLNSLNGHDPAPAKKAGEKWLTVEETAERLQVDKRWVYRHARNWRFKKGMSRKNLRISESGLNKWMAVNKA